jgi:hypothetical protein
LTSFYLKAECFPAIRLYTLHGILPLFERGFDMTKRYFVLACLLLVLAPLAGAQGIKKEIADGPITCRAMEVFEAQRIGATAVIFHQRDKADGPRLGELLMAHSGEEVEFVAADGQRHTATVARVKSCFGRGLLLFATKEAKLAAKDDFVLHFSVKK